MNHTKNPIVTFNSKKGVSIMIGYVLLVSFAIIIGGILYAWITTYVPKEALDCPDGVSIFVEEVICQGGNLNLTLRNNGRFDIAGYFIHATNKTGQELATIDLSGDIIAGGIIRSNSIVFDLDKNIMGPTDTKKSIFSLPFNINSIEIIPVRFQIEDGKQRFVSCGDAKIREIVNCDEGVPGAPETCGNGSCDAGETCENCVADCGCDTGWSCIGGVCVEDILQKRIIFVSSNTYNGNLVGLSGANTICNNSANASGLSGEFKAWLSDSSQDVRDLILPDAEIPFYLSDTTTLVANNSTDLLDGTLQNLINMNEFGTINNTQVWTGTNESGHAITGQHCVGWTSDRKQDEGWTGNSSKQNKEWTDGDGHLECDQIFAIYCFQTSGW